LQKTVPTSIRLLLIKGEEKAVESRRVWGIKLEEIKKISKPQKSLEVKQFKSGESKTRAGLFLSFMKSHNPVILSPQCRLRMMQLVSFRLLTHFYLHISTSWQLNRKISFTILPLFLLPHL
jgi:hypothetical protein